MTLLRGREAMLARVAPLLERLTTGGVVVEVGVYQGLMGEHVLATRTDVTWHGVDPWAPAEAQPAAYVASNDPHARLSQGQQDANHRRARDCVARFGERSMVHRMPSVDGARLFEDGSVDLVFLDGDHSYDGVVADVAAWWPKVRRGGWLGGHDWSNPNPNFDLGVDRAVLEWVEREGVDLQLDDDMTWWVRKS